MSIRISEGAQILYKELNDVGYARRFYTANPTERRKYERAAEAILRAFTEGTV